MLKSASRSLFCVITTMIVSSCGGQQGAGPAVTETPLALAPTFASVRQNIFAPKCLECHETSRPRGGFDVTSYESIRDSLGKKMRPVIAGESEKSGIYVEVRRKSMPLNRAPLSDEEIGVIGAWIQNGARND